MQSDIIINVKDSHTNEDDISSATSVSTDSPNTGYLSAEGSAAMPVLGAVGAIIILIIAISVLITKRHYIGIILRRNKRTFRSLVVLAMIISVLSFVGLKELNNSYNLASAEGDDGSSTQVGQRNTSIPEAALAISTDGVILNMDLEDDPVFAYAKDTIRVTASTTGGYTLVAYVDGDDKDLANTSNAEAADARIAGLASSEAQALTDNTWGLALQEPEDKDSNIFRGVPIDNDAPLTLKSTCVETTAGDETDVYIGAYVVPGLPAGTYAGVTINYVAVANVVVDEMTVNYHGNGLFFDEGQTEDENMVVYETYRCAINNDSQELCGIFSKSGTYQNTFGSDGSVWYLQVAETGDPSDILEFNGEDGVKDYLMENHETYNNQTIELYATKDYTVHFDANGGEGQMADQRIASGKLTANAFLMTDYAFGSWNTDAGGSGTSYSDEQLINQITGIGQTVTLYAQWVDCVSGSICYKTNGDEVEGSMGVQTPGSGSANLWASNFSRVGYGFAGWNTEADYSGTFYGPNQTVNRSVYADGLDLYAVWVQSAGTIQGWNGCSSLTTAPGFDAATLSSVTALTDERDGNTYAVARLADGNCWMIENLRLADKDSNGNDINLSNYNTNRPSLPITNVYRGSNSITSNHLTASSSKTYNQYIAPEGWCGTNSPSCADQSRLRTVNTVLFGENLTGAQDGNIYSYGNYYNWYSATAGNGKYNNGSGPTNVSGDICPASWHLPTGGENGEYDVLYTTIYDDAYQSTIRSFPANFVFSGEVTGSSTSESERGSLGAYWTAHHLRTGTSGLGAGILYFRSDGSGYSVAYTMKYMGLPVRCLIGV